jgi:hypothetical protein
MACLLNCLQLACLIYFLAMTVSVVFTGNWKQSLCFGSLSFSHEAMRTAELIISSASSEQSSPIVMLSKAMLRVQMAGRAAYEISAENSKHAGKEAGMRGCVSQIKYTEEGIAQKLGVHSSVLYKVVLAGEKLVINMLRSEKSKHDNSDPDSTVYICFHKLENNDVAAAVCLLATSQLQEHSTLWGDLGRAVMMLLNEKNAVSCGCRFQTILIKNWGAATEVSARRSFLLGMASQFQPFSVEKVEAIDSPC